jgi:uroporphyrinogen-III decarboxylase
VRPASPPDTPEAIEAAFAPFVDVPPDGAWTEGRDDLARRLLDEFGDTHFPLRGVSSPLWRCYRLWGFEGMMERVSTRPGLIEHACRRALKIGIETVHEAAALGAAGLWIEECFTDMISPGAFAALNVPFVRELVEAIRAEGMKSIYYFCGDPTGKWEHLLSVGADALSLEESKKGFVIDIEDAVTRVAGRCTVLGNLDAIGILQNGSDDWLRAEISRQLAAGRRNGSRFIMSLGSPVTPETPVERVRLYCDLVRQLQRM